MLSPRNRRRAATDAAAPSAPAAPAPRKAPPLRLAILTDRPQAAQRLIAVASAIGEVAVRRPGEYVSRRFVPDGIVADLSMIDPQHRALLAESVAQNERAVVVSLLRQKSQEGALGASGRYAFLSDATEPEAVMARLVAMLAPGSDLREIATERGLALSEGVLADVLRRGAGKRIDPARIDEAVSPILDALQIGGLAAWLREVRLHDDATFQHCLLVSGLTAHFATEIGLSVADRQMMARAAFLHDVGKAKIPLAILNKPGRLDPDELAVMRTHPVLGHEILLASGETDPVMLAATRSHHEMLDGSGYPDGLRGDAIPDAVRLLTICDIYAALIELRPYKAPMSTGEALGILAGMEGRIERGLVDAFARSIATIQEERR